MSEQANSFSAFNQIAPASFHSCAKAQDLDTVALKLFIDIN